MEVFKTYLFIDGHDEGYPYLIDTIFYKGEWWLVSSWLYNDSATQQIPERLVRLTGLEFEDISGHQYRFLLKNSIPKSVLDGKPQNGYVVSMYPALLHTQVSKQIQ